MTAVTLGQHEAVLIVDVRANVLAGERARRKVLAAGAETIRLEDRAQ